MKVIIVDDEPKAIALISSYLSHFSDFDLVSSFRNGLKALEYLNSNEVDVIFLDINMPHLSGLSLSKMIEPKTKIVFTTAYSEHAVDSYDVNAIDYLLKPISLERFSKAITKLLDNNSTASSNKSDNTSLSKTVFIKSGTDTHQIIITNIEYLQKDGNYMYYFVLGKKIMARQSIKEALDGLPDNFQQIQKSYIVNIDKINSMRADSVQIGDSAIPIGYQFKQNLLNNFK